jgi:hypothetical protein
LSFSQERKNVVVNALSRLNIDSLKIQEEKVLTLLSGSENNIIRNFNLIIPMHTALIFKGQEKLKGFREKGLAQSHYSMQPIKGMIFFATKKRSKFLKH